MATVASLKSGNWSDPSTWDGGVLPGESDVAEVLTNHQVTIDQNVSVQGLTKTGSGQFVLTGSTPYDISLSANLNVPSGSTGVLLEFDSNYSAEGTTISAQSVTLASNISVIRLSGSSGSATIHFTGSLPSPTAATRIYVDSVAATTNLNISASGYSTGAGYLLRVQGAGTPDQVTVSVTDSLSMNTAGRAVWISSTVAPASGRFSLTSSLPTMTNTVNSTKSFLYLTGVNIVSDVVINMPLHPRDMTTGIVRALEWTNGGAGSTVTIPNDLDDSYATGGSYLFLLSGSSPPDIKFEGDVTLGVNPLIQGSTTPPSGITVKGDLNLKGVGNFFTSTSTNTTLDMLITLEGNSTQADASGYIDSSPNFRGTLFRLGNHNGLTTHYRKGLNYPVFSGPMVIREGTEVQIVQGDDDSGYTIISNIDSELDPSDVRSGIVYDSDEKVGTMKVPNPEDVYLGVPVDDEFGTATVKLADAATVTGSQISSLSQ